MNRDLALKKTRQSNFELLRLVAMFLVLVVHSDFFSLGGPTPEDVSSSPISAYTRFFFESLSIVCVNVFVLISGWFGITPSFKSFSNLVFQCLYFSFGIYIGLLLLGLESFSFKGIAICLNVSRPYWFVLAYIGLYILSPILNAYVAACSKKQLLLTLIAFFSFQTIYGWIEAASWIEGGYSAYSFIGLYLLARYLRLYGGNFKNPYRYAVMYLGVVILNTLYSSLRLPFGGFAYVNPLVILASCLLLLSFASMNIKTNPVINYIGKSAFAVYLLHSSPFLPDYFISFVQRIFHANNGIMCLVAILGFILIVYAISIALDQPRLLLWNLIRKRFFTQK